MLAWKETTREKTEDTRLSEMVSRFVRRTVVVHTYLFKKCASYVLYRWRKFSPDVKLHGKLDSWVELDDKSLDVHASASTLNVSRTKVTELPFFCIRGCIICHLYMYM